MDALQDLEALMVKAKDMVRLAAELNEKLTAASAAASTQSPLSLASSPMSPSTEPEEATFIRSSLSQLGLQMSNAPVTLDMMKDERRWIEELARELGHVLQGSKEGGGMMKDRGIIALDEVWGGWNRARGVGKPFLSSPNPIRSSVNLAFIASPDTTIDFPPRPPTAPDLYRPSDPISHVPIRPERSPHTGVHACCLCGEALGYVSVDWATDDHGSGARGRHHCWSVERDDRCCGSERVDM